MRPARHLRASSAHRYGASLLQVNASHPRRVRLPQGAITVSPDRTAGGSWRRPPRPRPHGQCRGRPIEASDIETRTRVCAFRAPPGTTSEESAELKRLKREVAETRRPNEIFEAPAGFFAAGLDGPHRFSRGSSPKTPTESSHPQQATGGGGESGPIRATLNEHGATITPSTCHVSRRRPMPLSSGRAAGVEVERAWKENYHSQCP
jgi:hypothetical protein